jgi:S-adenosylmethionine:tRNA ribosyltransferase-isomerase
LQFDLPEELIAQTPAVVRGQSRLLVLDRGAGTLQDRAIPELPGLLRAGDVLVINDTRVLPARFGLRRASGGRVEGLFLSEPERGRWEVLLKGAQRLRPGEVLALENSETALAVTAAERIGEGRWRLEVRTAESAAEVLGRVGRMPLPPYIKRAPGQDARDAQDREWYQTTYATRDGAVAAPTAGLHFTPELLAELQGRGIGQERVTLHVGYGTFAPIGVDDLADHRMHNEYFEMDGAVAQRLRAARERGGRIVAVGTTSARVLETVWAGNELGDGASGWTDLFCYPPYEFRAVDVLLTNFHLPGSTLIALVMAFAGVDAIRRAYAHAIAQRYRFFSYGDAMLIV